MNAPQKVPAIAKQIDGQPRYLAIVPEWLRERFSNLTKDDVVGFKPGKTLADDEWSLNGVRQQP